MPAYEVSTATTTEKQYMLPAPGRLDDLEAMIADVRAHVPDEVLEDQTTVRFRVDGGKIIICYDLSRTVR
jgi:hypothetical protein